LLDQLEALARQEPILMLFEDAHWADATSLEVLDLTVERVRALPVLVLITFRPEYEAPWTGLSHVTGRLPSSAGTLHFVVAIVCVLAVSPSPASAREHRSHAVALQFQREHPCPSTGQTIGPCPGYRKDHINALACGGPILSKISNGKPSPRRRPRIGRNARRAPHRVHLSLTALA
jgi:hypothetical protein